MRFLGRPGDRDPRFDELGMTNGAMARLLAVGAALVGVVMLSRLSPTDPVPQPRDPTVLTTAERKIIVKRGELNLFMRGLDNPNVPGYFQTKANEVVIDPDYGRATLEYHLGRCTVPFTAVTGKHGWDFDTDASDPADPFAITHNGVAIGEREHTEAALAAALPADCNAPEGPRLP